jgi:hypothetical protein
VLAPLVSALFATAGFNGAPVRYFISRPKPLLVFSRGGEGFDHF